MFGQTRSLQYDLQFILTVGEWRMYPFKLPLAAPACCWVPFRLPKHRLSNTLSQHQSTPKQNYPSQPDKISRYPKENEPEVFLNTYPYTNLPTI